jgi:hypothetical protein
MIGELSLDALLPGPIMVKVHITRMK